MGGATHGSHHYQCGEASLAFHAAPPGKKANGVDFSYAIGDAGYDARDNYAGVVGVFGAVPVVPRTEELQSYKQRAEEPSQLGA